MLPLPFRTARNAAAVVDAVAAVPAVGVDDPDIVQGVQVIVVAVAATVRTTEPDTNKFAAVAVVVSSSRSALTVGVVPDTVMARSADLVASLP